MGDQQSRPAIPPGEGKPSAVEGADESMGSVAAKAANAEVDQPESAEAVGASGGASSESPTGGEGGKGEAVKDCSVVPSLAAVPGTAGSGPEAVAVPSESEILARLVASLGQCPNQSMALAEIRERLPPPLRQLAEDADCMISWLGRFPGLLEVSGPPGQEQVMLTVGKLLRPGAASGDNAGAGGGGASPSPVAVSGKERVSTEARPTSGGEPDSAAGSFSGPGRGGGASHGLGGMGGGMMGDLASEEDGLNPATVQLRGLPFRATIADIKAFLGEHSAGLTTSEPPIRLLLNRDGRPSGFARVQFTMPHAAQACREALHRKAMGDRYVEVLACSDRSGKMRHRRSAEVAGEGAGAGVPGDATTEYAERERVLSECREHMRMPGRNQLLLSMLGIALSPPARAYLRRANLGLKHFLARLPNEFRVEGPKGCERVIWCGAGSGFDPAAFSAETWSMGVQEPGTPKPNVSPSTAASGGHSGGHCAATPSDWGTPGLGMAPGGPSMGDAAAQGAAAAMDFNTAWGPYGWAPWWAPPWPCGDGANSAGMDGAIGNGKTGKSDATSASKSKRGSRGDAPPARSHAHLHPQSHPFANRAATAAEGSSTAPAPSEVCEPTIAGGQSVAALRLRGLPFSVTVQDVLAFFAQHDVADRIADGPQAAQLLPKANGRPSGQAVVQMRSRQDAEMAQRALYKQWIGGRYIEVFVYGGEGDGPDGVALLDEPTHAPPQLPGVVAPPGGDAAADWMQGLGGGGQFGGLPPWAGLMAPPPVAQGDPQGGDFSDLFAMLWKEQQVEPPARPTLQV